MNDNFTEDLESSTTYEELKISIDAINDFSIKLSEIIKEMVKPLLTKVVELIKYFVKQLSETINKIIKSYGITELHIPSTNSHLGKSNNLSQAPPIKEKSIKEIAIENFHCNMDRYKNSKLIKSVKREFPALVRDLTFAYIAYWLFKALGMQ